MTRDHQGASEQPPENREESASSWSPSWAILELFGHRWLAGRVSEATIAGAGFLRIDCEIDGGPVTQFYSPAAIYGLTPVSEEIAHRVGRSNSPPPVPYELPSSVSVWDGAEFEDFPADDPPEDLELPEVP